MKMGVRIDGDLDFQLWYYDKYNTIKPIVSHEVYGEYLEYKRKEREYFLRLCKKVLFVILIILIIKIGCMLL